MLSVFFAYVSPPRGSATVTRSTIVSPGGGAEEGEVAALRNLVRTPVGYEAKQYDHDPLDATRNGEAGSGRDDYLDQLSTACCTATVPRAYREW